MSLVPRFKIDSNSITLEPLYSLERWPYGWLVLGSAVGRLSSGAFADCTHVFQEGMLLCQDIAYHYRNSGRKNVCLCAALPVDVQPWRDSIKKKIQNLPAQAKWWQGLDIGCSASAIFAVFCDEEFQFKAEELGGGATPSDPDDLGRCILLLDTFPEWKIRLDKVAIAYPGTRWSDFVKRWDELVAADHGAQRRLISEIRGF